MLTVWAGGARVAVACLFLSLFRTCFHPVAFILRGGSASKIPTSQHFVVLFLPLSRNEGIVQYVLLDRSMWTCSFIFFALRYLDETNINSLPTRTICIPCPMCCTSRFGLTTCKPRLRSAMLWPSSVLFIPHHTPLARVVCVVGPCSLSFDDVAPGRQSADCAVLTDQMPRREVRTVCLPETVSALFK